MPIGYDEGGFPIYAEWTGEMKDALINGFKVLDASKAGVDRSKLRILYPMLGWNDIQKGLDALIADGRLESSIQTSGSAQVEVFTWKEV